MSLIQPCLVRINYGSFWICFSYFTNSSEISFSPRKLKQDFLQTGRNILPIQIMNDSSDDTNIKVIQLSKSYLCFTSFSFINNLSGINDFPHGSLLTPVAAAVFAITAPALNCGLFPLLLSSLKYFATFSITCCSSTLIDFPTLYKLYVVPVRICITRESYPQYP